MQTNINTTQSNNNTKKIVNWKEYDQALENLFMEDKAFSAIANFLDDHCIPFPAGKPTWQTTVM